VELDDGVTVKLDDALELRVIVGDEDTVAVRVKKSDTATLAVNRTLIVESALALAFAEGDEFIEKVG